MSRSQSTPQSSQMIWLESRIEQLEAENEQLSLYKQLADEYGRVVFADLSELQKQRDELLDRLRLCDQPNKEWQPIETAPKGRFLLLACPSGYTTTPYMFTTGRMCRDYHEGRWIDHANDDLTDWGMEPTHWMPLPEAPK